MPIAPELNSLNILRRGLFLVSIPLFFINFALPVQAKSLGAYTLSSVGWAMVEPARKALVGLYADAGATGRTFGVTELYAGMGAFLGPLVGGYVYDFHGAAFAFYMNGALTVLAGLLAVILLKE